MAPVSIIKLNKLFTLLQHLEAPNQVRPHLVLGDLKTYGKLQSLKEFAM